MKFLKGLRLMLAADIVILNGALITFDPERPNAQALAISKGVISAIGTDADIGAMVGPHTRIVDAGGSTVLPGFIDSHVHLFGGSVELAYPEVSDISGLDALTRVVQAYAAAHPHDRLILAVGADYNILGTARTVTRHDLDKVMPDRPFALMAADHHTVWANTAALEVTGLLEGGTVPAGAQIVMSADGKAEGTLKEFEAYGPVIALSRHGGRELAGLVTGRDPHPPPTPEERALDKDALALGLAHCAAQGITALDLMDGNSYQLELLRELEGEGRLLCRCRVPFHQKATEPVARIAQEAVALRAAFSSDMLCCAHVKMFLDGVLESGTALMLEPYPGLLGADENAGTEVFTQSHFEACVAEADRLGFQIAVHAVGEGAVRRVLDAYEAAATVNGARDARHRIEHLEVVHPEDLPRLVKLGVVASMQPGHSVAGHFFDADGMDKVLHPHQMRHAYPWQDLRDTGARVVFNSDWPVIAQDVMLNIKCAIAPNDLGPPWRDQTQDLTDTLASYTRDNAWVAFRETKLGMLKVGMAADIAVMSHNLTELSAERITQAAAVLTICDGRVTFDRQAAFEKIS